MIITKPNASKTKQAKSKVVSKNSSVQKDIELPDISTQQPIDKGKIAILRKEYLDGTLSKKYLEDGKIDVVTKKILDDFQGYQSED